MLLFSLTQNLQLGHLRDLLETTNARLALLEERQEFTEALLQDPERKKRRLGPAAGQAVVEEPSAGKADSTEAGP